MSTLSVWDFIDGHRDIFCKSMVPMEIRAAAWNPYLQMNADEFVSISDRVYHYWRITENLQLQYQEGDLPTKDGFINNTEKFSAISFVKPDPLHHSIYLMLGLSTGYVWLLDTRVNQYIFKVKVLADSCGGIQRIFSSHTRIVIEPIADQRLYCWDQSGKNGDKEFSPHNPYNLFAGVETNLSIDGKFKAVYYDYTGN